eukprot:CAMPEP_0197035168 /NCGR_PEP_ID=MMETSP1384-20130603/13038_1 /TAXON_ID=29189 /ORGANISM="Ammonia sp." /LENGTH=322 /DNA_ID=CAMNT_0042465193 /DNA_START=23 /DNA_END=991 /DNA_ORIENTATION=-
MSLDWICYVVSAIYATLLCGCLMGLQINFTKKRMLTAQGSYTKSKAVIQWKTQFFLLLSLATIVRITAIIAATVEGKKLLIAEPSSENEFIWQIAASFGSLLYFTAFTLIIWFFSKIIYKQAESKQCVTMSVVVWNVVLYCVHLTLGIADLVTKQWYLIYDIALPLFSLSNIALAVFFVILSWKIARSLQTERRETIDYHLEQSSQSGRYQRQPLDQRKAAGGTAYILPRLLKLSVLCALMWTLRGGYTLALRIWPPHGRAKPKALSSMQWEAIFYCVTEYIPSLCALLLMLMKPKKDPARNFLIQAEQDQGLYPSAVNDLK